MHKMMSNLPLASDVSTLKKRAPETLQAQPVTAVLLALGSNYRADHYLARVHQQLAALGTVQRSTAFQNPDFTATLEIPKPDYTNQCVHLSLTSAITLQQLQQTFKQFEGACHRQRLLPTATNNKNKESIQAETASTRQVTMDIDILLVTLSTNNESDSNKWIIMADRYPFKSHESAGIDELVSKQLSKVGRYKSLD